MYMEPHFQINTHNDGLLIAETDNKVCTAIARQKYFDYLEKLEQQQQQQELKEKNLKECNQRTK